MNSKLIKGSLAGVAALALVAGGSTFAAWSDFQVNEDNAAQAGHLILNVNEGDSSPTEMNLAPGENEFRTFYIASNDGDSVPDGKLYITLQNLMDEEDGCTANGEAVAEGADPYAGGYNPDTACGDNSPGNDNGELSQQARMEIIQYGPSGDGVCGLPASNSVVKNFSYVTSLEDVKIPVVDLAPGEATCVRAIAKLLVEPSPAAADDAVQGDKMSWDFRFDLEQIV